MSLMLRRRMLLAPKYQGYNIAYASSSNVATQYAKVEYFDKNNFSIRPTNKTTTSSKLAYCKIPVKPNTTYRIKAKITRIGNFAKETQVMVMDSSTAYISGTSRYFNSETGEYNITVNSGTNTVLKPYFNLFRINAAVGEENDIELLVEEFMMTEGTEDLPYEPYVG